MKARQLINGRIFRVAAGVPALLIATKLFIDYEWGDISSMVMSNPEGFGVLFGFAFLAWTGILNLIVM